MAVETLGDGNDSVGEDFSSLGTNELVDLVVMTMTSMVYDIAL